MKIYLLLLAVLLLFSTSALSQDRIEVPMKFRGAMPAVEVMVNGKGPFLFAIDTGGQGQARADTTLVETLGLKKISEINAGDGSGRNMRTLDVVEFDSLKIGELEFKKVRAASRNYNRSPRLPKIDGIIGFNLFKDHLLTLDYPGKKVIIAKGELPSANGEDILDYNETNGIASVDINVGGKTVKAHIDSGNLVGPFVLPEKLVSSLPTIGDPRVVGQARTVSNTIEIKQVQLRDPIKMGKFTFKKPRVTFPALRNANIGSHLLREFSIEFDQKNKRLRLARSAPAKTEAPTTAMNSNYGQYVGKYGPRRIFTRESGLYIQREGGPELRLKSTGKDKFVLEVMERAVIEFERDKNGAIVALKVLNPRGEWETSRRDGR